jgi:hypothetical protein
LGKYTNPHLIGLKTKALFGSWKRREWENFRERARDTNLPPYLSLFVENEKGTHMINMLLILRL